MEITKQNLKKLLKEGKVVVDCDIKLTKEQNTWLKAQLFINADNSSHPAFGTIYSAYGGNPQVASRDNIAPNCEIVKFSDVWNETTYSKGHNVLVSEDEKEWKQGYKYLATISEAGCDAPFVVYNRLYMTSEWRYIKKLKIPEKSVQESNS